MNQLIIAIVAVLGIVLVGSYVVPGQNGEEFGAVKLTNPDIDGTESVAIVFTDAKSAPTLLSQFTIEQVPCDPAATSTVCTMEEVHYKGIPVKVYAVLPLEITQEFTAAAGSFPFAGQLHYKDIGKANIDTRVIKLMEEQGNKTYDVIYEK